MIYIKHIIIISIVFLTSSCASQMELRDDIYILNEPHRVIPHNFENKYELVPSVPAIKSDT